MQVRCHTCIEDVEASIHDAEPRCPKCNKLLFEAMALRQRAGLDHKDHKDKKREEARQRRLKKKEEERHGR